MLVPAAAGRRDCQARSTQRPGVDARVLARAGLPDDLRLRRLRRLRQPEAVPARERLSRVRRAAGLSRGRVPDHLGRRRRVPPRRDDRRGRRRRNARGRRWFAAALTVSNHKPFAAAARPRHLAERRSRTAAGAVLYADWAIGRYLAKARAGAPARSHGGADRRRPRGPGLWRARRFPVASYRIPAVFLDARAGAIATPTSTVSRRRSDLAPTVLSLAGVAYDAPFFGHDLARSAGRRRPRLRQPQPQHRPAHRHRARGRRISIGRSASTRGWIRRATSCSRRRRRTPLRELARDAAAIYQTAYRIYRTHGYGLPPVPRPLTERGGVDRGRRIDLTR